MNTIIEKQQEKPIYPIDLINQGLIVPEEYEFFKNNGTTEIETTLRGAKSRCSVYTTNNNIIVRVKWLVSGFFLNDYKQLSKLEPIEKIVVAVSENHTQFKLGDSVLLSAGNARPVNVPNNLMSLENVIDVYKQGFLPSKENGHINISRDDKQYSSRYYIAYDYLILPAVMIEGIISEGNL